MRPKYTATSGETDTKALEKMGGHILGHILNSPDKIKFKLEVNLASIKEMIRGHQKLVTMEEVDTVANTKLTMRMILSMVLSWYDTLGLSAITTKYKIAMPNVIKIKDLA